MSGPGFGSGRQLALRFKDFEKTGTYVYVGYADSSGGWRIARRTVATGARQRATGVSGYAAAWTGRAGLTYA